MIRHNIKQSIRGMLKDKTFTFFNIAGFSVGMAVCLIIMIFIYREYSVDSFFDNSDRIYRLVDANAKEVYIDRKVVDELKKFPNIDFIVPFSYWNNTGNDVGYDFLLDPKTGNLIKTSTFITTNNDFFKMFGIKTIIGNSAEPFSDVHSIVLTESSAIRLFGSTDIIGKQVKKDDTFFTVSAVTEDLPECSSISADFFTHDKNPDLTLNSVNNGETTFYPRNIYICLDSKENTDKVKENLNRKFPFNHTKTTTVELQPLHNIYLDDRIGNERNKKANKPLMWIFLSIALLTLIMSVFNYANFAISRQLATLKQAGIRITNGAKRSQIRIYYFTEVCLYVLIAFTLSLLIANISITYASNLLDAKLTLKWLLEPKLMAITLGLLVIVVLLSAIAPVSFISRLKTPTLFGKTSIKSGKHPIKRIMTISQVAISIILLISVFTIHKQLYFAKNKDIGIAKSNILRLSIPWEFEKYSTLKAEFAKLPFVENLTLTSNDPGSGWQRWGIKTKNGKEISIYIIKTDKDFLKTFDMKLIKGRELLESDINKSFYLTEYAYKQLEYSSLEETKIIDNSKVVGIVNDMNFYSLHKKMVPVALQYSDVYYGMLNLKLNTGNLQEQMAMIENTWKKIIPSDPLIYHFYDQYFDSLYKKEEKQSKAITLFAIIAFMITCLGLLGQVLQNTQNRIKEIGIRKINGATIKEVLILLNKEFLWTVAIAFVIASPIAYYAMNKWLENFAYKTALSWWIFALAGVSALIIALITVSWQSYRAASRNPVEALRYE